MQATQSYSVISSVRPDHMPSKFHDHRIHIRVLEVLEEQNGLISLLISYFNQKPMLKGKCFDFTNSGKRRTYTSFLNIERMPHL